MWCTILCRIDSMEGTRTIEDAYGPFSTEAEADAAADKLIAWTKTLSGTDTFECRIIEMALECPCV